MARSKRALAIDRSKTAKKVYPIWEKDKYKKDKSGNVDLQGHDTRREKKVTNKKVFNGNQYKLKGAYGSKSKAKNTAKKERKESSSLYVHRARVTKIGNQYAVYTKLQKRKK